MCVAGICVLVARHDGVASVVYDVCGGPETRHGPRGSGSFTHGRLGLGSSCLGVKRPSSSGLLLALVLHHSSGLWRGLQHLRDHHWV